MSKIILGREAILAAKPKTVEVDCPELDGTIILRELKAKQMMDVRDLGERPDSAAAQLSLMVVDEAGALIFSKDDIEALNEIAASLVAKLLKAAAELNGLNSTVETAEKNSETIPSASSAIN